MWMFIGWYMDGEGPSVKASRGRLRTSLALIASAGGSHGSPNIRRRERDRRRHGRARPGHPRVSTQGTTAGSCGSQKFFFGSPCDHPRRCRTRLWGGAMWMAGTSPAMTTKALRRCSDSEMAPQRLEKIESGLGNVGGQPSLYGFTHLPLAFDDLTAASTNSSPLTPSSMVGKCADLSGFLPTRAALMASATSE
jgi:hypothetical protein